MYTDTFQHFLVHGGKALGFNHEMSADFSSVFDKSEGAGFLVAVNVACENMVGELGFHRKRNAVF